MNTIREARASDCDLVAQLPPASLRMAWTRHYRVLVPSGSDQPAAVATFRHYPEHLGDIAIAVRPEARRRGYATALLGHIEEFACEHGSRLLRGVSDVHACPVAALFATARGFSRSLLSTGAEVTAERAAAIVDFARRRPGSGTVRRSRPEDRGAISGLIAEHVQANAAEGIAAAEDLLAAGVCTHMWVLEEGGSVAGAVAGRIEADVLHIEALVVVPELRYTGAAAQVLATAFQELGGIRAFRFFWAAGNAHTASLARHFGAGIVAVQEEFTRPAALRETAASSRTSLSV